MALTMLDLCFKNPETFEQNIKTCKAKVAEVRVPPFPVTPTISLHPFTWMACNALDEPACIHTRGPPSTPTSSASPSPVLRLSAGLSAYYPPLLHPCPARQVWHQPRHLLRPHQHPLTHRARRHGDAEMNRRMTTHGGRESATLRFVSGWWHAAFPPLS